MPMDVNQIVAAIDSENSPFDRPAPCWPRSAQVEIQYPLAPPKAANEDAGQGAKQPVKRIGGGTAKARGVHQSAK